VEAIRRCRLVESITMPSRKAAGRPYAVPVPLKTLLVMPSRFGSTRFPGKPAASIRGVSLLERVWRIAKAVPEADEVIIATDDNRIAELARGFGAAVVMTSAACENGTERVQEVVAGLKAA